MPKFEKQYVHFMWDDELKGKEGFFEDDIDILIKVVTNNCLEYGGELSQYTSCHSSYPFTCEGHNKRYRFFYYDPYYDLKLAHEQGKTIQYLDGYGEWQDMDGCECVAGIEYRIKSDEPEEEKPVTNRELARWLAQGNGEYYWYDDEDGFVSECGTELQYPDANTNDKVVRVKIRKWEDTEWKSPTREYMGLNAQEV